MLEATGGHRAGNRDRGEAAKTRVAATRASRARVR
jgi:hypothetical protein